MVEAAVAKRRAAKEVRRCSAMYRPASCALGPRRTLPSIVIHTACRVVVTSFPGERIASWNEVPDKRRADASASIQGELHTCQQRHVRHGEPHGTACAITAPSFIRSHRKTVSAPRGLQGAAEYREWISCVAIVRPNQARRRAETGAKCPADEQRKMAEWEPPVQSTDVTGTRIFEISYSPSRTSPGSLAPKISLCGSSIISFTLYKKLTLSLPSMIRWS